MRRMRGSYTIEAAFIMSLFMWIVCVTVDAGTELHGEVVREAQACSELESLDSRDVFEQIHQIRELMDLMVGQEDQ